jgi:hypothetical protein
MIISTHITVQRTMQATACVCLARVGWGSIEP